MSVTFPKNTKVWPVHRDPKKPQNVWCGKPVTLNRQVVLERAPVPVDANGATKNKFSRFVEINKSGNRRYQIFLFGAPVPQGKNVVVGFVADTPK